MSGSFTISLPDGRVQTTTYQADHYAGFTAQVEYQGAAQYPPRHKPYHRQYPGTDRLVLSYTPSPYVAAQPYKSALAFPPPQEEEVEEETGVETEQDRRRYRKY